MQLGQCARSGAELDYQVVIRDPNVIEYFNDKGVWQSQFGAKELIATAWVSIPARDGGDDHGVGEHPFEGRRR